jgi:hypothetical protein
MIVEKEFKKSTGISFFYSCIKINAQFSKDFCFRSIAEWPLAFDDVTRCEEAIHKGIIDTLSEQGFSVPFGSYTLESVKVSEDPFESVPIAYYWATQDAIRNFLNSTSSLDGT